MEISDLEKLDACKDAVSWCRTQPDITTAWRICERGDWMLWLVGRTCTYKDKNRIASTRIACRIARDVLHLVAPGEDRPRLAIEATEAWCDDPTPARAAEAAKAAAAASGAASCAAAAASEAASCAGWAAAAAASRATGTAAEAAALKKYAGWVREIFPEIIDCTPVLGAEEPPRETVESSVSVAPNKAGNRNEPK